MQLVHPRLTTALALLCTLNACSGATDVSDTDAPADPAAETAGDDLSLGDVVEPELKADGWGHALECKPVPDLPVLGAPEIHVSLNGLTLRLVDPASGFEKVFPIGPGAIDTDPESETFGESLSYFPVLNTGRETFEITPRTIQPCKTWWTDPKTQSKSPVFAGLPFLSWHGNYAIHGPIDNYTATNGGNLRRGFVSHGCLRMEAADVLELYARIKGVAHVPVHVQREPERREDGTRVDLTSAWIGSECDADADCNFDGGLCKTNAYSARGFCTKACQRGCPDKAGAPVTFCVPDPDDSARGMCVNKVAAVNADCRPYDHFVARKSGRYNQPAVTADVCLPGSPGWIGDHCFADTDCKTGNTCHDEKADDGVPGVCSQPCAKFCPDLPGFPMTFCATEADGQGFCARGCTADSNASECAGDQVCTTRPRQGRPGKTAAVCAAE